MKAPVTLATTLEQQPLADRICSTLSPAGVGMWLIRLSDVSPQGPVTHRGSSGDIEDNFAALLGNAQWTYGACRQVPALADITLAQIEALYAASVISDRTRVEDGNVIQMEWEEVFNRAGMWVVREGA